jgi:hypothetical protein
LDAAKVLLFVAIPSRQGAAPPKPFSGSAGTSDTGRGLERISGRRWPQRDGIDVAIAAGGQPSII